jgi:predicted DNA-binding ribbon-helix-helix protein
MSCTDPNDFNVLLRRAVRAAEKCGQNATGARADVAAFVGLSANTVGMRVRGEITGPPRRRQSLEDRVWAFLDMVASRQRAWLQRLEAEIEQKRAQDVASDLNAASSNLESARRALADFDAARRVRERR